MRTKLEIFPVYTVTKDLVDPAQSCWPALVRKVTAAYQIMLDGNSYFIVEGDLPRADLESCIPVTFLGNPPVKDVDGMLAVQSLAGTAYAAWRGNFIVIGTRPQVVDAIATHDAAWVAKWEALLPKAPAEMAMVSIDTRYSPMMGEHVAEWAVTIDKFGTNPPFMSGSARVRYASAEAAKQGFAFIKDWSSKGKFPFAIEADADVVAAFDGFAAAVGRLEPKLTGSEVVIPFDSDRLGGAAFFAGVASHFDKLAPKPPAK